MMYCVSLICLVAIALPDCLSSQQDSTPKRTPDVHFVPTDPAVVRAMLRVAKVGSKDVVYDLGCGDGRFVITAVKRYRARGVCVDIDPLRIEESRRNADTAGVTRRITFHEGDLFEMDLSDATVVTLYLLPALNERLRPKLFQELRPGSRVVSNAFDMGDWKPDSLLRMDPASSFPTFAYYWMIPADVSGTWNVGPAGAEPSGENSYQLRLEQRYQEVTGTGSSKGRAVSVTGVRLKGDSLGFTIRDTLAGRPVVLRFAGRVTGDRFAATVAGSGPGKPRRWTGLRTEPGPRPEIEPQQATD